MSPPPGADPATTTVERELARQLATLTLSGLGALAPTGSGLNAAAWWNGLLRLGIAAPLVAVHDLGLLIARPALRRDLRERAAGAAGTQATPAADAVADPALLARYQTLLRAIAGSESLEALGVGFVRDEVIAVLLARLLGEATARWSRSAGARAAAGAQPLPLASPLFGEPPAELARAAPPGWAQPFLHQLLDDELALRARLDQLDLGPVRLLGLFPPGAVPPDLVDLNQLFGAAGAGNVVDFCLQLLPSLLETKRQGAPQRFSIDGYASVERRGPIDALLPGELAHDPEVFALRALSDELLFYGHERPREGSRRVHGVLVDASASMRGVREVFARGLALALAKKLALLGTDTWLRFFDSRLHRKVEAGRLGGQELPYVLCFRSERGRNYARVFEDLLAEVKRERDHGRREVAITFITHAECRVPRETIEALARQASLYGVFVLPSVEPVTLDYLPLLGGHQVVTAASFAQPAERRRRALEIVGEVAAGGGGPR